MSEERLARIKQGLSPSDIKIYEIAVGRGLISARTALESGVDMGLDSIRSALAKLGKARLIEPVANGDEELFTQFRPTPRRKWLKELARPDLEF